MNITFKKGDRVRCVKGDTGMGPKKQVGVKGIVTVDYPQHDRDSYVRVEWDSDGPCCLVFPEQIELEYESNISRF